MPASTQNSGVDDPQDQSNSNASSVRYIPGLNFLPNSSSMTTTSSPMRHRHLNDLVNSASSSTSSIDSPPRKLSAAVSASGNGAPSPRRKPRRRGNAASKKIASASVVAENGHAGVAAADANGDTQQQQQQQPKTPQRQQQRKKKQTQQQQQDETARQLNSSITNYFPVSPKYGANNNNNTQNNNNNNNDVDGERVNNGITALSGITHLCNGNSTSKQQQQQQPATTATPGKKKKRRRKKTTANADASSSTASAATAAACPHHHGLLSPTSASKNDGGRIQSQLTDFYQVRRSDRRPKSEKDKEEKDRIVRRIKDGSTDGLRVDDIPMKGRGVVADKNFRRGEFVIEYDGDLIDCDKAKQRETEYRSNPSVGCYMYYFTFQNRKYCVDATSESGKLGRLINHSTKTPNLTTRLFPIGDRPHLIFIAARDIDAGEELMYDYGDRSKEATEAHPWLKT